jgi:Holliday junction resolvase RusA-like endonuclease
MPRPRAHFGARGLRPAAPAWPTVRPDVLKLARAVEDALTGLVWRDDSQIVVELLTKQYGEQASCEVLVAELGSQPAATVHRRIGAAA